MTTAVATYQFPATGTEIRTVIRDGEPWFVGRDVCAVLEIRNVSDAMGGLDDDEKGVATTDTPGGLQDLTVISEAGLYSLILRSRKPEAKAFKRWVTHDVLPAIRKTGRYEVAAPSRKELARMVIEAEEAREQAEAQRDEARADLAEAQPAADAWNTLASADGDFSVGDAAKILTRDPAIKLGRDRLFTLLGQWGWAYRQRADNRWRVKQTAIETRRLSEIPSTHFHPRTGELINDPPQVRVTFKGLSELHRRLGGTAQLQIPGMTTMRPLPTRARGGAAAGPTPTGGVGAASRAVSGLAAEPKPPGSAAT